MPNFARLTEGITEEQERLVRVVVWIIVIFIMVITGTPLPQM
jgi:hypothetical protein